MLHTDYIEFPATDIEATKRFCQELFGRQFTDYGPEYASFEGGRRRGFHPSATVPPDGVLVVLYSSDLEAARRRGGSGSRDR